MRAARSFLALALAGSAAIAQSRDERSAPVGMRAHIDQLVLTGSELEPAPAAMGTPIVLRVLATWPHGEHFRYDLEWYGLETGAFDLAKFLQRKNGSSMDGVVAIPVTVTGVLKAGELEPPELDSVAATRLDGYRTLQIAAAIAWGAGLLAILFIGRRRRKSAPVPVVQPTLADRLRPLVATVAEGRADDATKAELERVLVSFWRARLDLREAKAAAAIVAIRRHPEAGALLRQLEQWLHVPAPVAAVDLDALLAPYRAVSADDLQPIVGGEEPSVR